MKHKTKAKQNKWADHLTKKARSEKYPARSVYKLMEIQEKFSVIRKKTSVLDLGCAPGSWLLYAARTTGRQGKVVGIDLKKINIELPENTTAYIGNILNMDDNLASSVGKGYKTVLSDMAPSTTGRKEIDSIRSFDLCMAALDCAVQLLSQRGNFVCKIFQGADFKQFEAAVKTNFMQHYIFKPKSCRKSSKEIYVIGKNKK